jgi:hypothetical protein
VSDNIDLIIIAALGIIAIIITHCIWPRMIDDLWLAHSVEPQRERSVWRRVSPPWWRRRS